MNFCLKSLIIRIILQLIWIYRKIIWGRETISTTNEWNIYRDYILNPLRSLKIFVYWVFEIIDTSSKTKLNKIQCTNVIIFGHIHVKLQKNKIRKNKKQIN